MSEQSEQLKRSEQVSGSPSSDSLARIEDVIEREGAYVGSPAGVSMRPFLRDRRDTIVVEPLHGRRLRRFEVALYRRGDVYVLHRVVGVGDRSYTMLGDNCLNKERGIPGESVIGVLTGCYRGEKRVDLEGLPYRAYVRLWYAAYPLRRLAMRARGIAGRMKRGIEGGAGGGREGGCS